MHIEDHLKALGFAREWGGGGTYRMTRFFPNGANVWVTDCDGSDVPANDDWFVVTYGPADDDTGLLGLRSDNIGDARLWPFAIAAAVAFAEAMPPDLGRPKGEDMEALSEELATFCSTQGLPLRSADELVHEIDTQIAGAPDLETMKLNMAQGLWVTGFIQEWEQAEERARRAEPEPVTASVGIAAAPFAIFYHSDGYSLRVERHDGPSPARWTVDPPRLASAIEIMLEGLNHE